MEQTGVRGISPVHTKRRGDQRQRRPAGKRPECVDGRTTLPIVLSFRLFFFQAEDGIRDTSVTGVQTCALPISVCPARIPLVACHTFWSASSATLATQYKPTIHHHANGSSPARVRASNATNAMKIGRASCRERVSNTGGDG